MSIFKRAQDPISSETHFWGAVFSMIGFVIMIITSFINKSSHLTIFSVIVFGISLVLLYSASSVYHFCPYSKSFKNLLRKVDHSMIYVLIAGTYTPLCFGFMPTANAIRFLSFIWIVTAIGILSKIFWLNAPRTLYTILYLLMGWAIIFDFKVLTSMPTGALALLLVGGLSYSIGAFIYIIKKPNISEKFGFHELFHIFILIGSLIHFLCVLLYII
jgi:hemolysin III